LQFLLIIRKNENKKIQIQNQNTMNKIIYFLFTLFLVAVIITGCKKDNALKSNDKPLSNTDLKLANMAKSFTSKLSSPLKSGELIEVDSAVWYMILNINFNYGDAGANLDDVSIYKANIPLEVSGEFLSIEDVSIIYDAILDSVSGHYYGLGSGEKALTYVSIVIDTIFSTSAPDAYELNVTSVVQTDLWQIPTSFGPTDYWWWADGGGKCGPYSGYTGQDAMTQLEHMYQINLPCPSGGYWVPETYVHEVPESFPVTATPTNYCGWYMFLNSSTLPNYHECLSPEEMNFYLYGLNLIGNTLMAQKYPNIFYGHSYYCIGVRIYKNAFPNHNNGIAHGIYSDYATAHYGNPGGEL